LLKSGKINAMKIESVLPKAAAPVPAAERAALLEKEACRLRTEGRTEQACQHYDQAAKLYQEAGSPSKAATCYASAADCWNVRTGRQSFRNAAARTESAAVQAFLARDYRTARDLFGDGAILYRKEGDDVKRSYCYLRAKDAHLRLLWHSLLPDPKRKAMTCPALPTGSWKEKVAVGGSLLLHVASRALWGHGERPFRTLVFAAGIILVSAVLYRWSGQVVYDGFPMSADFGEALYFSVNTFTTLGYGDLVPLGWTRMLAGAEALSGMLLAPLFMIALARRYLRIDR